MGLNLFQTPSGLQFNSFFLQKQKIDESQNILFVSCSDVNVDKENGEIVASDCVNGTWLSNDFNGGITNYSYLSFEYHQKRENPDFREDEISYEQDIMIFENKTKLKINIEGCVNTLDKECKRFYEKYGMLFNFS